MAMTGSACGPPTTVGMKPSGEERAGALWSAFDSRGSYRAPKCHRNMVCLADPTEISCRAERCYRDELYVRDAQDPGCRYTHRLGTERVCRCPARNALHRLCNTNWLCT